MQVLASNVWEKKEVIGSGSFGDIYREVKTGRQGALKVEKKTKTQLRKEWGVYQRLGSYVGVPSIFFYDERERVMVMELLGPSIEDLFNFCSRCFTLKTTLMLADQMAGFVHCDMKPENWLMGTDEKVNVVHLIDFGLSEPCPVHHDPMAGTPRYASIAVHAGLPNSVRDDLEAFGYMLVYFLKGILPWQGQRRVNVDFWRVQIAQAKIEMSPEELTDGLPKEFSIYFHYCRSLKLCETPDYSYLRTLFRDLFFSSNLTYDFKWDWVQQYREYDLSQRLDSLGESSDSKMEHKDNKVQEAPWSSRGRKPESRWNTRGQGRGSTRGQGRGRGTRGRGRGEDKMDPASQNLGGTDRGRGRRTTGKDR